MYKLMVEAVLSCKQNALELTELVLGDEFNI